ncbi:hypothetical protein [Extensimonas vulgaris]|uniref:DnaJ-like protein n=1 Tax=Extensimonas vulgaris TaxID=1031594 RepID=A0A369AJG9_9BURK|nr:hypothetical protein [Extensimonas vulgaris]RCX09215.1 hypothetical protein DFR45_106103 [Extensimonas vulgaris]TWI37798.1 hypothetical protein IP95_01921 [Extensimonas vulgaris]TXD15889.1 hypothetical protein FUT63_05700 [Extensimonas vulgaris]
MATKKTSSRRRAAQDDRFGAASARAGAAESAESASPATATATATANAAPASARGLQVLADGADTALTPAAKAYNRELARIDKLKAQIARTDALGRSYQTAMQSLLAPLYERRDALRREMVALLVPHVDDKRLSKQQRQTVRQLICAFAAVLAADGDAEMARLHDKYSPQTLAEIEQQERAAFAQMASKMLGEEISAPEAEAGADASHEDLMMRMFAQTKAKMQEQQEEWEQEKAARKKKPRKLSAAQQRAEAAQQEAESTLRAIFRQLASALHPDRAASDDERQRKTELMAAANRAYQDKDIVALLQIQRDAALLDPAQAQLPPEKRLQALTQLLKQQVLELEQERYARQNYWEHVLDIDFGYRFSEAGLRRWLQDLQEEVQTECEALAHDVALVRDGKRLKSWLNEQHRLAQEPDFFDIDILPPRW